MGASDKNGNHSQARTEQELNGCARRGLAMPRGSNSRYAFRGLEDSHGSFPHRGHHGGFPQREKEWWIQNVLARDLSQDGRVGYQGGGAAGRQGDHQGFLYGRRHGWRSCGFRCWRWWWRLPSVCDGSVHLHGNRAGYRKCQGWCYARTFPGCYPSYRTWHLANSLHGDWSQPGQGRNEWKLVPIESHAIDMSTRVSYSAWVLCNVY